ncbi:MAG: hypothetical protein PHO15_01015 [Eubacteriales bacterium]|nr:hypothetical protein [Eubacteriales bacterium]
MNGQEYDAFFSTLILKKELLQQMLVIMEENKALLDNDQIDEFKAKIQDMQTIIHKINELNALLPALKQKSGASLDHPDIIDIKNGIKDTLRKIIKLNNENNRLAEKKQEEYKGQIRNMNQAKKRLGVYANRKAPNAIFFDTKK